MTDQTPITRAELDALIAAAVARTLAMTPEERDTMMEAQRQSWADGEAGLRRDTEPSASPPRVPAVSLPSTGNSVTLEAESGPGQPMTDICAQLDAAANSWRLINAKEATRSCEAAAEIRRLREQITALKFSLDLARDCDKEAAQLIAEGRRAGIEEAAQIVDAWATREQKQFGDGGPGAAIRALADKSAPDPRLAGLEYVRREWFKIRTTGATLAEWLDVQIAARTAHKGGDNS